MTCFFNIIQLYLLGYYFLNMKKFILSIFTCMSLFACQQEIDFPESGTFSASIEKVSTKTSLSQDNSIYWNSDDEVVIFNKSTVNDRYKVVLETAGSTSCALEYVQSSHNSKDEDLNHVVAFYPYSSASRFGF